MKYSLTLAAALAFAVPASAQAPTAGASAEASITVAGSMLRPAINDDYNKHWLDYRSDVAETKRELAADLRDADDEGDVREAWAEYYREVRDAQKDYTQEMAERGYQVVSFKEQNRPLLALGD